MLSGRFDTYRYKKATATISDGRQHYDDANRTDWQKVSTSAFTYRAGLVYLPIPEVSLYASAAVAIANMAAESLRDKLRKAFWRKLFFELTRSEKHRSGIRGRNFANILKPQALRQNIVDAAVRTIEICMGADGVHAVFC